MGLTVVNVSQPEKVIVEGAANIAPPGPPGDPGPPGPQGDPGAKGDKGEDSGIHPRWLQYRYSSPHLPGVPLLGNSGSSMNISPGKIYATYFFVDSERTYSRFRMRGQATGSSSLVRLAIYTLDDSNVASLHSILGSATVVDAATITVVNPVTLSRGRYLIAVMSEASKDVRTVNIASPIYGYQDNEEMNHGANRSVTTLSVNNSTGEFSESAVFAPHGLTPYAMTPVLMVEAE